MSSSYQYGIVVDAGSLGSRLQVYRWTDPQTSRASLKPLVLSSVPKVTQEKGWTLKTSPGISSFGLKPQELWTDHLKELVEHAEGLIPRDRWKETPMYVFSTAGMRLLPPAQQEAIKAETCRLLQTKTKFYVPDCDEFVQTIDGETEGIYGWIGLNYLSETFNNHNPNKGLRSVGFMDMGGASTQIAFVPSASEQVAHHDDLRTVTLRSVNGDVQEWKVFVSTWLGFGANEARKRYVAELISQGNQSPTDPCLLRGSTVTVDGLVITGRGDFAACLQQVQPLLRKNLPCKDEPCLFDGVHTPHMDFTEDRFVGILEYWYTVHDLFNLGGDYSFRKFNEATKLYCQSPWSEVVDKDFHGRKLSAKTLQNACFKAAWIVNVLHEGFNLPRLDLEVADDGDLSDDESHVPFSSAESINGVELSWTLGKMVLFASSQVAAGVGIHPSSIEQARGLRFIPGGLAAEAPRWPVWPFLLAIMALVYVILRYTALLGHLRLIPRRAKGLGMYLPAVLHRLQGTLNADVSLEEGLYYAEPSETSSSLRTRSTMGLSQLAETDSGDRFYAQPFAAKSALFTGLNSAIQAPLQRSKSAMGFYKPGDQ